jgi:hypothetical protein
MAYIKNIETVFKEMDRQKIKNWQVFDKNKVDIIAENSEDEGLSVDSAINELKEVCEDLEGMVYIVIRRDGTAAKRRITDNDKTAANDLYKGIYKFTVKLGNLTETNTTGSPFATGSNSLINMVLDGMKLNFDLQLKHIQEKAELEKTMEEKLRKFEEKLNGKGENNNVISDEMAQKAMILFDKFLSK